MGPVSSALRSIGFGGLTPVRPALKQRPQEVTTQMSSLPPVTPALSPADRMGSGVRELVLAATGNPFWAKKAIEKADEVFYSQAV